MSFLPTPPPPGSRAASSARPVAQISSFLPTAPLAPTAPTSTPSVHSPLASASSRLTLSAAKPATPTHTPTRGRPPNSARLAQAAGSPSLAATHSPVRGISTPPHSALASLQSPAHSPSLTSSSLYSSISSSDLSSLAQTSSAFASIQSLPLPSVAAVRESNAAPARELEQMFYGFGDDIDPSPETLQLSQRYVEEFLVETTRLASRLKESTLEEGILYVIRNDRKKRARAEDLLNRWEQLKAARTFNDAFSKEVATLPKELVEKE